MIIEFNNDIPIYIQVAQAIEDSIIKGIFKEDEMIPSTTEISVKYKIRGVGMFVSKGSKELLMNKRKESFFNDYIVTLLDEAKKLNISIEDIIKMINKEG